MPGLFSPSQISKMTSGSIRKEYSRLRSIANKRLERLEKAGLGRRGDYRFPTLNEVDQTGRNAGSELAEVSRFLRSERTTVRGERKFISEFQRSMQEMGYGDMVKSVEDVYNTIDFMDQMREEYSSKIFDSGDALDVLQEGQRLKIPKEKLMQNFDLFAANLSKMEKLRKSPNGREFSQSRINKLIKKWS